MVMRLIFIRVNMPCSDREIYNKRFLAFVRKCFFNDVQIFMDVVNTCMSTAFTNRVDFFAPKILFYSNLYNSDVSLHPSIITFTTAARPAIWKLCW